jgi:hypothetical protein
LPSLESTGGFFGGGILSGGNSCLIGGAGRRSGGILIGGASCTFGGILIGGAPTGGREGGGDVVGGVGGGACAEDNVTPESRQTRPVIARPQCRSIVHFLIQRHSVAKLRRRSKPLWKNSRSNCCARHCPRATLRHCRPGRWLLYNWWRPRRRKSRWRHPGR